MGHGPGGWARREELLTESSLGRPGVATAKTGAMRRPPGSGEAASEGVGGWGLWGRQEPRKLCCAVCIWASVCVLEIAGWGTLIPSALREHLANKSLPFLL